MQTPIKAIQEQLKAQALPEAAQAYQKFVPHAEKLYGVRTPILTKLAGEYKQYGFDLAEALWQSGWYEERIIAGKILERMAKKDPERALRMVATFSKEIDNWAVCDCLGMQSLKTLVKTHEKEIFALAAQLNTSKNCWQRRLSLVLVEWYTRYPDRHAAIMKLVTPLQNDTEYYVKKAVAWICRNFEKRK
jgi:3-methyladenine DNA glycosylase AlkD